MSSNATEGGYALNVWKAKKWAHLPGTDVPTVPLPDGTVAEAIASLAYGWDPVDARFAKIVVDHDTGAIPVVVSEPSAALYAFANIAAGQTDAAVVAAVTAKKIRVLALACVTGATATTIVFNSKPAGAGAAKSATFQNGANGGEVLPYNPQGWFETVSGEGLSATTGGGSTTGVQVVYSAI